MGSHENPDTILITLALLSSVLANVTELAFTGASIRLLDRALPPSEWEAAFAVAATQVTKLKVTEAQPDQVITLFHHLPSLCNVHLRGDSLFADSDVASLPASAMLDVLAGMSLDHLKLEPSCVGRQMAERSLGGIVGDRSWASALRSLDVTLPSFDTQGWAFITSFAPSLESLNVKCSGNILDGPPPAPIFPRLTHLTVAGSAASVAVILALFSKSPIQQVDVTLMGIPFDHLRLPLQLLPVQLQPFERLRHVIVDSYPTVGPAYSIENLAITLQRRSVTLETPFPSTKTLQDYPESLEVRRHVVRVTLREVHGVLNATRRLMLRMSDNGEVEKLHEVLRATQGIVALKREEDY